MVHLQDTESNLLCRAPLDFDQMVAAMLKTEQTKGMSVYQHGQSVADHVAELLGYLRGQNEISSRWRLPDWLSSYRSQILNNLHEDSVINLYALYHDCGKPYCLQVDEAGRRHFLNHAKVSQQIWSHVGGDETVGHLIGNDMVLHTATAEEIASKLETEWSCEDSVTLLISALSEIHSNAKMFGGLETVSFKSKWKQIDRRGRQLCRRWFGESLSNESTGRGS